MKTISMQKDNFTGKLDYDIEINNKIEPHENICKYIKIYKWEQNSQ